MILENKTDLKLVNQRSRPRQSRKMADGENLSPDQTEKLLQFQDLSGIEDMERCRDILQRHHWDIEVAVQARFAEEEGRHNIYNEQRREVRTPPVDTQPIYQRVYTVARPQPQGIFGWGYFIVLFPFRFVYTSIVDILKFAYRLLRPDPRRIVTDPVGDVHTFVANFKEKYAEPFPEFYEGSYSQALNEAKRDLKFLLVYLHGDDHEDTDQFCTNTLCTQAFTEFVSDRLIFWSCNTNSPEGYRVSLALRENTYPFLALIVLRNNKMTVVARIEGPMGVAELVPQLLRLIEDNEGGLIAARTEREEHSFNRSLREEQDAAYLESLRADQEKEKKKQEEQAEKERLEREEQQKLEEEKQRLEEREQKKETLRLSLPAEPDSDEPDAIKILLKLPNGTRLERRFLKTQSLKVLHDYVFVHEAAPDDFQIVTNFPRRTLPCDAATPPSFEEVGLGKSEMLFVHDNEA